MIKSSVSIILPVYNEEQYVDKVVRKIARILQDSIENFEIVIIESGSTDNTPVIVDNLEREIHNVIVVHQEQREGMGSAVSLGITTASMEYFFLFDADEPFDFQDIFKAFDIINSCDIVSAFRLNRNEGMKRKVYSGVFNWLVRSLFNLKLRDINFSYKLYSSKVFEDIKLESKWGFHDAESLIKAHRKGFVIKQIGINYLQRELGESKFGGIGIISKIFFEMIATRCRMK